jgi:T5SS/PEP-CTERM-associated repeat protein
MWSKRATRIANLAIVKKNQFNFRVAISAATERIIACARRPGFVKRRAPRVVLFAVLAITSGHLSGSASAQSTTWTNPGVGDWFNADNWSGGVPSDTQDASIRQGAALVQSPWAVAQNLSLSANGSMIINNPYTLDLIVFDSTYIGAGAGSNSFVTVSDFGTSWEAGALNLGSTDLAGGNGTLRIESASRVISNTTFLALDSTSNGSATMTGAGSNWQTRGLFVGERGTGSVTISNEGAIEGFADSFIGDKTGSSGSVNVTGANSLWDVGSFNNRTVHVGGVGTAANGHNGAGTLQISSGGRVRAGHLEVLDTGSAQVNNGSSTDFGLAVSGAGDASDEPKSLLMHFTPASK